MDAGGKTVCCDQAHGVHAKGLLPPAHYPAGWHSCKYVYCEGDTAPLVADLRACAHGQAFRRELGWCDTAHHVAGCEPAVAATPEPTPGTPPHCMCNEYAGGGAHDAEVMCQDPAKTNGVRTCVHGGASGASCEAPKQKCIGAHTEEMEHAKTILELVVEHGIGSMTVAEFEARVASAMRADVTNVLVLYACPCSASSNPACPTTFSEARECLTAAQLVAVQGGSRRALPKGATSEQTVVAFEVTGDGYATPTDARNRAVKLQADLVESVDEAEEDQGSPMHGWASRVGELSNQRAAAMMETGSEYTNAVHDASLAAEREEGDGGAGSSMGFAMGVAATAAAFVVAGVVAVVMRRQGSQQRPARGSPRENEMQILSQSAKVGDAVYETGEASAPGAAYEDIDDDSDPRATRTSKSAGASFSAKSAGGSFSGARSGTGTSISSRAAAVSGRGGPLAPPGGRQRRGSASPSPRSPAQGALEGGSSPETSPRMSPETGSGGPTSRPRRATKARKVRESPKATPLTRGESPKATPLSVGKQDLPTQQSSFAQGREPTAGSRQGTAADASRQESRQSRQPSSPHV